MVSIGNKKEVIKMHSAEEYRSARQTYITTLSGYDRPTLLKLTRAAGFAAHKLQTDLDLILLLWEKIGRFKKGGD